MIRRRLGRGGMGEVFLADQLGPLGPLRHVALKRMLPQLAKDERAARMFLEEMGLAAQLNHPNIATTFDFGEVDGVYFIAMEFVDGLTLSSIESVLGALPVAETVSIVAAIAEALAHAHEQKKPVVHCDVSPQNVMVSSRGAVKLLDFGIAAMETALSDRARGKISYASPEQILGETPNRRFDIWSLGVLTYETLAGTKPIGAETGQYARLDTVRPELKEISKVVDRALSLDPSARWASAEAFSEALRKSARTVPAQKEKLAQLIERSGGAPNPDEPVEMTGTGVAVVMPSSGKSPLLQSPPITSAPITSAPIAGELVTHDTTPIPPKRGLNLGLIAMITGLIVLGAAAANLASTLEKRDPVMTTQLPEDPAPTPPRPNVVERIETERKVEEQQIAEEDLHHDDPLASDTEKVKEKRGSKHARKEKARASEKASERSNDRSGEKSSEKSAEKSTEGTKIDQPSEANGLGVLSVRTTPWAKVSLDGKNLGEGVVAAKPVPSGTHTLVLTPGDDRYAPRTLQIEIRVGIATKVFVDFETGAVRVDPS